MGLSPSFTLGPFDAAAARRHVREARLRPVEVELLSRLIDIATEERGRSLRISPAELAAWLPAERDAARVLRRLVSCRWLWRGLTKRRERGRADLYHLTFDLLPGRSTTDQAERRERGDDVKRLLRSLQSRPAECPVLGVFARVAGVPAPMQSRAPAEVERRRAFRLVDWAIRECVAAYYEAIRRDDLAARVRRLPEVRRREAARELVEQAAAASKDSRVKALAHHYLRASAPGAPGHDTTLEHAAAAAFAGAMVAGTAQALREDFRKEASRLLFELVIAEDEPAAAPAQGAAPKRRRPPVRSRPGAADESDDEKEGVG